MQMATVLFYLTDVEVGGETIFPLEGRDGLQRLNHIDYRKCDMGLKVGGPLRAPVQRKALCSACSMVVLPFQACSAYGFEAACHKILNVSMHSCQKIAGVPGSVLLKCPYPTSQASCGTAAIASYLCQY